MYHKAVSDSKVYLNLEINSGEYQSIPKWISRKETEVTLSKEGNLIEDSEESSVYIIQFWGVTEKLILGKENISVFENL